MRVVTEFPRTVREVENLWIPMKDGARLAARMWIPADAETARVPAILEYIPYRKRDWTTGRDEPMHPWFAGHGYAVLRVDLRGSGDSDGTMTDEYAPQELNDAVEAIAWIAKQPWCTGKVGMMGNSWGGFNSLQVAALRPPSLKAIITSCSTDDRYADDMHYMGGCLLNDTMDWGSTFFSFLPRPPDPAIVGERWRAMWMERLEALTDPNALWLEHQRRDAYWKHGSICEDYRAIRCAVLAVGGWLDGYTNAIPRMLAHLRCPRRGIIGPWAHMFPHMAVPGPGINFLREAVRWWDHWLKGTQNGAMDGPMLRAFMGDAIPAQPFYRTCPGRWVAEEKWPSRRIRRARWRLGDGRLSRGGGRAVSLPVRSPETTGLAGGEWCPYGTGGQGPEFPADQREDDGKSLVFDSPPLAERLEILGAPVATLSLQSDRPTAYVVARLCDVAPDGSSTRVSYGVLNLSHRESHEHLSSVVPGERYTVHLQLNDAAYSFGPGHRLRLAISTGYWPMIWPAPEPVTLTVHTDGSALDLPVRLPRPEDAALSDLGEPETAVPSRRTVIEPARFENRIERDLKTGTVTVSAVRDDGVVRLESNGIEMGRAIEERMRIREGDPLSAETEMKHRMALGRGDWRIHMEAESRLSAARDSFRLVSELRAWEGDSRVFERKFERTIPRDGV